MRRALLMTSFAFVIMTSSVEAQSSFKYRVLGPGTSSCGTWLSYRRTEGELTRLYESWILGFLSGVGLTGFETGISPLNGVDAEGVFAWVDNYCRAHPLEEVHDAGKAFVLEHPH